MSDERSFKNEKVLEKAVDVINQHTALSFDIISDHELRYSNLEGHVLAIYEADDASSPHVLTPYFNSLRTYNVTYHFDVPKDKIYYIVDITEHTGKDLPPTVFSAFVTKSFEDAIKEVGSEEEDSEDRFQGVLGEQLTNDCLEVESDIEVDIEIEEVPIDNDFEIVKKVNKNNSDYSVAGFKKLTESRDECEYTPIEEAMEEVGFYEEEDKVNQPSHYTFSDKFEIIDVVEEITSQYPPHLAFAVGNAIKYIARSQHKNGKQDISKSIWYLQRVLEKYDEE